MDFVEEYIGKSRGFLNEMLSLDKDELGRDILVGLTREETEFYCENSVKRLEGSSMGQDAGAKWITLHDKHERARFEEIAKDFHRRNPQG